MPVVAAGCGFSTSRVPVFQGEGPLTEEQQAWFDNHWLLQYDGMFGEDYLNTPGGS